MLRFTPLLTLCLTLGLVAPAQAGGVAIRIEGFQFRPATRTVPLATDVTWRNEDRQTHTATARKPYPGTWNLEVVRGSPKTKRFHFAGTFGYVCRPHPYMTGSLRLPLRIVPTEVSRGQEVVIRLATATIPAGWSFEVQHRVGTGQWRPLHNGVRTKAFTFTPGAAGRHYFQARLERGGSNPVNHGFSPSDSFLVS